MQSLFLLILGFCLVTSFLLSGMEAGVFALSRLRIRQQARAGNRRAAALYGYLEHPEDFLWTILVGNTVSNVIVAGIAVIGLYHWLGHWLALFGMALVVGGVLFYAICELLPKTLFRLYPNRLCMVAVLPFRLVHLLLKPLVSLMAVFSGTLLKWTGGKRFTGRLFGSRDEFRIVMQESAQGLSSEERVMINRVLDLQNLTVRQITIPMSKAATVSVQTSLKELLALYREQGFSRLPAWKMEENRKRIIGVVNLRSLLYRADLDETKTAGDYVRPALYLDNDLRLEVALRQMQRSGQRLAIVLGKDRAELGVISLQDILKAIFGEVKL